MKINKKPLSIYIHIPFCKKKCLYCDFLSAPACFQERESYVKALLREISGIAKICADYEVISVFFGGGTPSLLSKGQMKRIMSAVRKGYCLCRDAEITVECNPATADFDKLSFYRECGINRLSIGLQSANDRELKELGRIHNYVQFLETFQAARNAGFHNINIDIMSALPGQTYESYLDTLEKVTALNPEHISAYSLIIEEGTPFYDRFGSGENTAAYEVAQNMDCAPMYPCLPTEDTERKMYHKTKTFLQNAGYFRYEISNYAKKGYECRHNLSYWKGTEYLGFGIGAASYFGGCRFKNCSEKERYQEYFAFDYVQNAETFHALHEEINFLTKEEQMEEFMFLGLRLKKGVSRAEFRERFQVSIEEVFGDKIQGLHSKRLLCCNKDRIYLSQYGMDIANYVMAEFLLE